MIAVAYRVRSALYCRWPATLGTIAVVALVCVVPIAVTAGARRTSTAADRYTAAFGSSVDGVVTQEDGGPPRTREVAALPGVLSTESYTFVFGGLSKVGASDLAGALVFAGSYAPGYHLISGRDARRSSPEEFVASQSFVDRVGAAIGDRFDLVTLTQEQALTSGFSVEHPGGPQLTASLVGVVDGPSDLDFATPSAYFPAALLGVGDIGISQTMISTSLRPGVDLDALRAQLDTLPDRTALSLQPAELISPTIRRAVDAQAQGLWLLAAVAGIATVVVLGQLIIRQTRLTAAERDRLKAMGFTRGQLLAESFGRATVPIVIGALIGTGLAVIPSGMFPIGFVRRIEPHSGLRVDSAALVGALAVVVVALLLWTLGSLISTRPTTTVSRPSRLVDTVAASAASVTAATGLRLAFGGRGKDGRSSAASVVGVLLTIGGLSAALVFGSSLNRLVREPDRFGSNYDFVVGDQGADELPGDVQDSLAADPNVTALTVFAIDHARVGLVTVPVLGMESIRGNVLPNVLRGRLPVNDGEIAFGRVDAAKLGIDVGEMVTLAGPNNERAFRVTGLIVVPGLGPNEGLGEGAILTVPGLRKLNSGASLTAAVVRLQSDDETAVNRLAQAVGSPPDGPFRPAAIVNVARVRAVPFMIALFLGSLALLTIAHVVITSPRGRRRDLAILSALGADRRWIARVVHWQATWFTIGAALIGLPIGVILGRLVFKAFADGMGAQNGPAFPVGLSLAVVVGLLVLANAAAVVPAWRARRTQPAFILHRE